MLSWNCQGLGRTLTADNLKACIREKNLDCVFFIETKMKMQKMTRKITSLGFVNFEIVPAVNKTGGLCFAWRNGVEIDVVNTDEMMISAIVFFLF